jgi:hypothetical protein
METHVAILNAEIGKIGEYFPFEEDLEAKLCAPGTFILIG